MSFLTRSRIWPTDASTVYWRPRNFFRVLVLAGLSTITRFLVTMAVNALRRSSISPVRRNAQLARAAEAGRGQYHRPPRSARRAPAARRSILVTTGLRRPGGMNRPRTGLWWFPRSVDRISPRNPSIPFPPHSPEGGGRGRHLPPACWRSFVLVMRRARAPRAVNRGVPASHSRRMTRAAEETSGQAFDPGRELEVEQRGEHAVDGRAEPAGDLLDGGRGSRGASAEGMQHLAGETRWNVLDRISAGAPARRGRVH